MKCSLCKNGETKPGEVTVILERGASIVLIKKVPAEICNNCGNYYLSDSTTDLVMKQGEKAISSGAELEIVQLKKAS